MNSEKNIAAAMIRQTDPSTQFPTVPKKKSCFKILRNKRMAQMQHMIELSLDPLKRQIQALNQAIQDHDDKLSKIIHSMEGRDVEYSHLCTQVDKHEHWLEDLQKDLDFKKNEAILSRFNEEIISLKKVQHLLPGNALREAQQDLASKIKNFTDDEFPKFYLELGHGMGPSDNPETYLDQVSEVISEHLTLNLPFQ